MAKNLLYIEALSSIALEHWEAGNDKLDNLSSMQKKALKKEVSVCLAICCIFVWLVECALTTWLAKVGAPMGWEKKS